MRVGVMHPGSMGAAVGSAASGGAEVLWAGQGRSSATATRAAQAGMRDVDTLEQLTAICDVIISLVPPAAAEACAAEAAAAGFAGVYVDANALSPDKTRRLSGLVGDRGSFVDGCVVGPPARQSGTTRLYLAGDEAPLVAGVFAGSVLEAIDLGSEVGAASALKMAYAAYTKGSSALIMAVRALAEHHHLTDQLLAEWALSIPELGDRSNATLRQSPRKAWRFAGEMEEIASTFQAAGLPGGFHDAAAELYGRLGPEGEDVDVGDALRLILEGGDPPQPSD